ncbi:uncharacterized protein EI90DRAFT_1412805 [Cantharellus anzutake]|uniref:uncharacterized protein n=1 Tax=Cantharellus anzutake TaxID=1750568 RepID=UPI001904565D|nr:uncharacterized protein EI90DRAFT_1412805 [Cantharellus anzutake]KAF8329571.1 hypothetical protein EI90DRAFT_1412805 [Cantharellus anzutake]
MRKQWKKEFAECPTEAAQINRLKSILTSLGMKGRMSMEQAKAIREKRELKAELDDVIRFERSKGVNAQQSGSSQAGDDDESDSEGNMTKLLGVSWHSLPTRAIRTEHFQPLIALPPPHTHPPP